MSSEKNTENPPSELFRDPGVDPFPPSKGTTWKKQYSAPTTAPAGGLARSGLFENLAAQPKTLPSPDGSSRGPLEGYGPNPGRVGISNHELQDQIPPKDQRKESYYYGVKYWYEHQFGYSGITHKIICFACDAVWAGSWDDQTVVDKEGTRDNTKSVLVPRHIGSGTIDVGGKIKRCGCNVGALHWNKKMPTATQKQIDAALELDARLADEGAKLIEENGGTVRGLFSKHLDPLLKKVRMGGAPEKAEGMSDPPGGSPEPEEPPPHEDEDFI